MRSVNQNVYDKEYYLHTCLGSEEFSTSKGKKIHPHIVDLLKTISFKKTDRVLDIGCGRGDITLHIAKDVKEAVGIDYAKAAITLANDIKKTFPQKVQEKTTFYVMNTKKLTFPDNSFDKIISIDVLEHLYPEEADVALEEMQRVLKKDGLLILQTDPNKILFDTVFPYYIYPMNRFLTWIDQKVKKTSYDPLPKDPRTKEQKIQHVNEPTYFYLRRMMRDHRFTGRIVTKVGYLKEVTGVKSKIYNFIITLYPLSKFLPLSILFSYAFIAYWKKK